MWQIRVRNSKVAFSLIEMLVVFGIFSIIALALTAMLESTSGALVRTTDRVRQFGNSRLAFDYITRNIKQSTLNTYLDYHYDSEDESKSVPDKYSPMSDLQFKVDQATNIFTATGERYFQSHAVFFQAPLGSSSKYIALSNLLNARGYFIEFSSDLAHRPDFFGDKVTPRYRFRLKEFHPPGELNLIYKELKAGKATDPVPEFNEWFRPESDLYDEELAYHKAVRNVAENIVALIVSPRIPDKEAESLGYEFPQEYAPEYVYDSRNEYPTGNQLEKDIHQLPPLVKLIVVTISERSAVELQATHGASPPPEVKISSSLFVDAVKLDSDLEAFEKQLREHRIEYRVFQTVIGLQASKWSDEK